MFVFHFSTKPMACSSSLRHCAGDQVPTPVPGLQKWPLKWVPISWPSSHARRTCSNVVFTWSSAR